MPTITIKGPDSVHPELAQVLRDNQIITWTLASGLQWDSVPEPVEFLPADGFYSKWPGGTPKPVGPKPPVGTPDTRNYEADTKKKMPDGKFQFYHYQLAVRDSNGKKIKVRVRHGKKWYDPDVVNEPRP